MANMAAAISNLGYVVFGVKDLGAWADFAHNLMGFQIGTRDGGNALVLRMDEHVQRIVLEKSDADDIQEAGWEFETEDELERYAQQLRVSGLAVMQGERDYCAQRCVEKLYYCEDPNGYRHAFYYGPAIAPMTDPFRSSVLRGAGFETGRLGIGHILTRSDNYPESVAFYRSVLGLRVSDYIREEREPGIVVDATFMHTKTGRHHSLATAAIPGPKRLNHVMVEVKEMDDVGLAYDRCMAAGAPMLLHLGHHPNDQMFSFYVQTPSGFALEYGCGGIVIDDATWKVVNYSKLSDWGHKRTPPVPA
ncbi:glyoxalase [Paraburkholderia panacisoli]|uniref:Glyoxalase n=2 Tax=Paraburkholderia panacisoli TaxID=2603818 RepID=A0A5B0G8H2_9BURK|nr:glyoxalase [Paraburkholderia panacisoli]